MHCKLSYTRVQSLASVLLMHFLKDFLFPRSVCTQLNEKTVQLKDVRIDKLHGRNIAGST